MGRPQPNGVRGRFSPASRGSVFTRRRQGRSRRRAGDLSACEPALEHAEQVRGMGRESQTGGWLRFDGTRLPRATRHLLHPAWQAGSG